MGCPGRFRIRVRKPPCDGERCGSQSELCDRVQHRSLAPAALVESGFMTQEPRDPAGNPYFMKDGAAGASMEYEILELKL